MLTSGRCAGRACVHRTAGLDAEVQHGAYFSQENHRRNGPARTAKYGAEGTAAPVPQLAGEPRAVHPTDAGDALRLAAGLLAE